MPAAEIDVSLGLVRSLLADQQPDLAHLSLEVLANGWDNLMCRLGPELVIRLPRRALAANLLVHEQQWLPLLAPRLPLPIPAPVRLGRPAAGYPWSWSIVPFLPGQVAARQPPAEPRDAAVSLGRFLGALHIPAPPEAPVNTVRGVPLADRSEAVAARLSRLEDVLDCAAALGVWEAAIAVPPWTNEPAWLHGDLHPANILVSQGRISAVIDFGDITSGDPATDLSVAWMLLPAGCHDLFREAYSGTNGSAISENTWIRAKGWALSLSLAILASSADNQLMAEIGHRTADAVLA
jgi:aminoglycoside phosphotransferase (APT) family kinase protein